MIDGEKYRYLKSEFAAIDKKDIEALRAWFEKYNNLSNNQLARLLEISNWSVRDYKSRAGLKGFTPKHRPRNLNLHIATKLPTSIPRDIPNDQLEHLLATYSMNKIAQAMGISVVTLYDRIKRRNLKYRSKKEIDASSNPCCNYDWLYENYFLKYRSCAKCAKLAGVYPQTISSWLNKFKIPLLYGQSKVVWLSDTLKQLQQDPVVKWIKLNDIRVKISYHGFVENYYYNKKFGLPGRKGRHYNINEQEFTIRHQPRVNFKYSSNDISRPNDTVYSINREEYNKYNVIEKRLAIHRFMHTLKERGYKMPIIPDDEIQESIDLIHTIDPAKYRHRGCYITATSKLGNHAGKKLIISHYNLYEWFRGIYNNKLTFYKRLIKLIKDRPLYEIDEVNLQMIYPKPMWFDYIMLAEIIKDVGAVGPILDLSPLDRQVSVTATRLGVPIFYPSLDQHQEAIDRGYFSKLGCDFDLWNKNKVNTIVAVYFDRFPELDVIKNYLAYGKRMVIVPRIRDITELSKQLPPKIAIRYKRHPAIAHDYTIFVY